jgi:2-dehydro-3-deoxyphosphogluconate aldolase/(4S)-4-hydroxy-2-oxoglutarate aldolase
LANTFKELVSGCKRIVPVISLPSLESALPLADTLGSCGFTVLEITMRTDCALQAIALLRRERPDLIIGAGTVKNLSQLKQAMAAGSQFIVSPGINVEMIKHAQAENVHLVPGVMTPSEIMLAENLGLSTVKLFPASLAGGTDFIQSMSSVFPAISFFPTGGVTEDNVNEYLNLDNVLCAGGTWLTPKKLVENGDWTRIHEIAQRC